MKKVNESVDPYNLLLADDFFLWLARFISRGSDSSFALKSLGRKINAMGKFTCFRGGGIHIFRWRISDCPVHATNNSS